MKTEKQKRQKKCFTSAEIAHVWAHQNAPVGRVSGGNKSFNGGQFKSYWTTIANIVKHRGKRAFVLDIASFSNTTSSHQNGVRQAIPDIEQKFFVHCGSRGQSLEFTAQTLRDHYLSEQVCAGSRPGRPILQTVGRLKNRRGNGTGKMGLTLKTQRKFSPSKNWRQNET